MEDYLNKLNPQQRDAVLYCDGPQLVIAGAGSGKTRVLTYKIVHLLKLGYFPSHIMALTFTNKAAGEMRERIQALVGEEVSSHLWMGTFHSIFAKLLRINADRIGFDHDFTIYDTSDSRSLIKLIIKDMQLDDKVYKPATIHSRISMMKNALITPLYYESRRELREEDERAKRPMTAEIYKTYCHRCKIAGAMDFDDILVYTNILLRDNPEILKKYQERFEYILVDEYQDTNFAQHLIITQLAKSHNHVCVVGDDAQSIYSFRGANISNILDLKKSFPKLQTFKLERNYRSTQNIIGAANSLIDKNKRQIKKNIYSENPVGTKVRVIECPDYKQDEPYEVVSIINSLKARGGYSYNDFAVLYRTNAQSRLFEDAFKNGGTKNSHGEKRKHIPFRIYGGKSFYEYKIIKDIVAYFRVITNNNDDEALRRIINFPARGIGSTTVDKIQNSAMAFSVSMWEVINNPYKYKLNINKGTLRKLQSFTELINSILHYNSDFNAYEIAKYIIEHSGIKQELIKENSLENIVQQELVDELLTIVYEFVEDQNRNNSEFNKLTDFLTIASLATDQDTDNNTNECVTLMTVHAAKGLEYKNVIIVGLEEGLFPTNNSLNDLKSIEEERRLLYVAITRAEENCIITYCKQRFRNGEYSTDQNPSRFLRDIDPQFLSMGATSSNKFKSEDSYENFRTERRHGFESLRSEHTAPPAPRPQPSFKPVSQSTPPSASASSGDFTLHSLSEISEGSLILHNKFGQGTIAKIDTSGSDPKIIVEFDVMGQRTLLLKFAKFKIL